MAPWAGRDATPAHPGAWGEPSPCGRAWKLRGPGEPFSKVTVTGRWSRPCSSWSAHWPPGSAPKLSSLHGPPQGHAGTDSPFRHFSPTKLARPLWLRLNVFMSLLWFWFPTTFYHSFWCCAVCFTVQLSVRVFCFQIKTNKQQTQK